MTKPLLFSVLVPTRDRPDLAARCVQAVLAQPRPPFEMLLLDQSDGSATEDAIRQRVGSSPHLRHFRVEGHGRSRALNAGIPLASGTWIVLTDDDCEPAANWLQEMEREVLAAGERAAIVGRVVAGPLAPGKGLPPATIDEAEPAEFSGRIPRDIVFPNFAVPRAAFAELGLFDERLGIGTSLPGGEDNDFGYRMLRSGWRILYRTAPVVTHHAWRSREERDALKRAYGLGQGGFYAKHLARGDLFIAYRLLRDIVGTSRAAIGATARGLPREARGHLAFLGGLFAGFVRMATLRVTGPGARRL